MKTFYLLLASLLLLAAPALRAAVEPPCALDCLLCPGLADDAQYAEGIMKSMKRIAPGKDSWLFRSEVDLSNDFGIPTALQPQFKRLIQAFAAKHVQVVIAVQPTRGMMHRDKVRADSAYGFDFASARRNLARFLDQLRAGGALVPDILPLVDSPPQPDYFFRRDHHWTPTGAQATARIVAEAVQQQPFYSGLTKKDYRTEPSVMVPKDGTMSRALKKICGNNYGFQYVRGFQTVPAGDDSSALFEDESTPEVILVGTSNSANRDDDSKNYNFDGYLKEYLGVDILNLALPGAGQEGALLNYLQSADYSPDAPPKMIIWELPASFHLEDPLLYRQLLPAIQGGCAKAEVLAGQQTALPPLQVNQRIEIFSNSGAQRRDLSDLAGFLDIQLSDKNLKDFYLITYYDNGQRDKVWYRREAIVAGGQFYLELSTASEYRGANLLSVFLEPTEALTEPGHVEIKLCR
ncbi:alginate O-acetyltransferase AlgX-related protein [Pseudomonas sp.]|uniref:alginate O-acetyltransferase AlgX-related protein n=1 Tax=Pseudomonas sp. TaxID=306 RepID=UPI002FC713CB